MLQRLDELRLEESTELAVTQHLIANQQKHLLIDKAKLEWLGDRNDRISEQIVE